MHNSNDMRIRSPLVHWLLILALLAAPVQGVFAAITAAATHDHADEVVMTCHAMTDDSSTAASSEAGQDDSGCHSMSHCCVVLLAPLTITATLPGKDYTPAQGARLSLIDLARPGEPPRNPHA